MLHNTKEADLKILSNQISKLSKGDQGKIEKGLEELKNVLDKYGDLSYILLALTIKEKFGG